MPGSGPEASRYQNRSHARGHCAQVSTLDPSTHAYSFWEGVPESSRRAFGALFRASKTLQVLLAARHGHTCTAQG